MYKENCDYDIVIKNGRVIDPADQIDSVANVGIANNTVVEITNASLEGRSGIDAKGTNFSLLCSEEHSFKTSLYLWLLFAENFIFWLFK